MRKVKFWNSIVSRFALFFTGLIIFAILLSGYLVFRKSSVVILQFAEERIRHAAELAEQSFYALLGEVTNDIAVISSSLALQNFVNTPDTNTTHDLEQLFRVILKNKPDYFQIRLIDDGGKEIIRFDKTGDDIFQMLGINLQQKGERDYFQEAIELEPDEYYFSKINLNEEYGVVSHPPVVTLRAASPVVASQGSKYGMVIINVDLARFYEELNRLSRAGIHFYLIDPQGQYLYAPEHHKEFAIQRGTGYSFRKDFDMDIPASEEEIGEFQNINGDRFLHHSRKLTYFRGERQVYLISAIEENILLLGARKVRTQSLQTLSLVCIISILMSYFFTRLLSKQINRVTHAVSSYEEGDKDVVLPVTRRDEIGVLARSFTKMRSTINQTLEDLSYALKQEKKAKNERDEFLQNMSHELRTPLHAIQGLTQLLRKNNPDASQLPIIRSLERSVNNLSGLVYDVLDHQKLAEGKLSIQPKPTNIATLLEDIYGNYQFEAVRKGLVFSKQIDPALMERDFMTDPLRLSQIVVNLVVNAIKYTSRGEVCLHSNVKGEDPPHLEVMIKDTGIGINPENLNKINERFFRESDEISGRYGGYGLGLSIVKQLVILFGGTLKAQSEKERGSTFIADIPIYPVTTRERQTPVGFSEPYLPKLDQKYRIIHIDDDLSTLELFSYLLDKESFQLVQLNKLHQLKELVEKDPPDLLVSDLMLGDKSIIAELTQLIKSKLIDCPVIIISAMEASVVRKISPYWFQKPFDTNLMIDLVHKLLGRAEYDSPDFINLYGNYDHDREKISRILELLEDEFKLYISRTEQLMTSNDPEEWQALVHKLIAHTRDLKLSNLSVLLEKEKSNISKQDLEKILNSLKYCLCCIRFERLVTFVITE